MRPRWSGTRSLVICSGRCWHGLLGSVLWWHPCTRASGSHLAVPRSDLSNHMELAEHHTPASALRGSAGALRSRATRRCGWEVCRWFTTTHTRHIFSCNSRLLSDLSVTMNSSLAAVCCRFSLILGPRGSTFHVAPLAEGGLHKRKAMLKIHIMFPAESGSLKSLIPSCNAFLCGARSSEGVSAVPSK